MTAALSVKVRLLLTLFFRSAHNSKGEKAENE